MPEGGSSYYTNAVDPPQDRYEDYIVKDLICDVERKFPVAAGRSNRAIVGVSMGGFGAVNLALRHPELLFLRVESVLPSTFPAERFPLSGCSSRAITTRFLDPLAARRGATMILLFWFGPRMQTPLHISF